MRRLLPACVLTFAVGAVACGGTNSPLFDDEDGAGGAASTGEPAPSSSGTSDAIASSGSPGSSSTGDATSSASSGEGGSGASSGEGGSGGATLCGDVLVGDPVPAVVVLTLDASGSMAGGDGVPDKWGPTTSAIESLVDVAPSDLEFGLVPFPAGDFDYDAQLNCGFDSPECVELFEDNGCEDVREEPAVDIAALEESGPAIVEWMQERTPDGGTPTYWALRRSYEIAGDADAEGDRFVILFTDGEPNTFQPAQLGFPDIGIECRDLQQIEEEVAAAAQAEPPIRTFVVGAPGSEGAAPFLSDLAVAGGTAPAGCSASAGECHVQIGAADYEDDLALALADIAGKAAGCRFVVPLDGAADVDLIEVMLETGRGDIEVNRDPDHAEGWDLVVDDPATIELYGSACELYREEASNVVRVLLLCPE